MIFKYRTNRYLFIFFPFAIISIIIVISIIMFHRSANIPHTLLAPLLFLPLSSILELWDDAVVIHDHSSYNKAHLLPANLLIQNLVATQEQLLPTLFS